jgi:hypothetical protein
VVDFEKLYEATMQVCDLYGLPLLRWAKVCHLTGEDCEERRRQLTATPCFVVEVNGKLEFAHCVYGGGIIGDLALHSRPEKDEK